MPYQTRRTSTLTHGRLSYAGAWYFLTWCTAQRRPLLHLEPIHSSARQAIAAIEADGDAAILAATIMPDHLHLLISLGTRLAVSQLVAKTKAAISRQHSAVAWQMNFFEHRLRTPDAGEDFAFYLFMNPYVAGLCSLDESWPGWIVARTRRWGFEEKLRAGKFPQPEWLGEAERLAKILPTGAG